MTKRVFITGANRGIGYELTRQYVSRGDYVIGSRRKDARSSELESLSASHPERLKIVTLDVADESSIERCVRRVQDHTNEIDVLINNAGIFPGRRGASQLREGEMSTLSFHDGLAVFRVNSLGPLLVAQAFLPLLRRGKNPRIASISSGYGSLANNDGFPYYYAASKAALNMFMRSLAADQAAKGVLNIIVDPGWVRTDMGGSNASLSAEQSARGIIEVIDRLEMNQHGQFVDWRGRTVDW